jgi:hypothetical protein
MHTAECDAGPTAVARLVASRPGKRAEEGGNVSGYPVVDVAIGLSFVFLTLSVFATSIVEAVAGLLSYRARSLEDWLAQNLTTKGDAPRPGRRDRMAQRVESAKASVVHAVKGTAPTPSPEQKAARHILGHPVVYAMTKGTSRPSYVPRDRFVSALLGRGSPTRDRLVKALASDGAAKEQVQTVIDGLPEGALKVELGGLWGTSRKSVAKFKPALEQWYAEAPMMIERVGALIDDLPDGPIKKAMHDLWLEAGDDATAFRKEAEDWFDQAMQRVSGWYKRRTQVWLWAVGFVFAVALDVDAIRLANALWQDQSLRQVLVDRASSGVEPDLSSQLGLPLGWDAWPSGFTNWFSTAVGLVLTSAAVSLGAPFWFDSLGKLANLRNSGPPPKSSEPAAS